MSYTILADENIPAVEHFFGNQGEVRLTQGRSLSSKDLKDIDVLLVRSVSTVDETLLRHSGVKFVGSATSGIDHIDLEYLRRRGIAFAHAPGSNANSVVEYVLAAIAAIEDKLEQLLAGGKLGIVGFGCVGKLLAQRMQALGIAYCVYDPWLDQSQVANACELSSILACDVVSLHAELTHRKPWPSFHLLDAQQMQQLQPGSLLINASRGAVVDNEALLARMKVAPALQVVLDVWENEPGISAPLLDTVALGTAHIAGYSHDGKILATRQLYQALMRFLQEEASLPRNVIATAPHIDIPDGLCAAALVRNLIQARYDIHVDDTLLRSAVRHEQPGSAGQRFDQLRKSYRQRRELFGSEIHGRVTTGRDQSLLQALGCTLKDGVKGG